MTGLARHEFIAGEVKCDTKVVIDRVRWSIGVNHISEVARISCAVHVRIDLVGILKRVYGPEPARRVLTEQFLPVFEEDEIIFPDLPEDEQAEPGDLSK